MFKRLLSTRRVASKSVSRSTPPAAVPMFESMEGRRLLSGSGSSGLSGGGHRADDAVIEVGRHGADDGAGHNVGDVKGGRGADDAAGDTRRGRGKDDAAGHQ